MDSEGDNKFLAQLHESFQDILEHAIAQNCIVCVPMSASISEKHITRRFIRTPHAVDHMLKPSPYVPHLFQSLSNKNLIIKQDEIKSHTGYTNSFTVMIVKEENSHDAKGKVYKQVTISAPLDDTADKYTLIPPDPIYQFSSAEEFVSFLKFAVEGSEAAVMFAGAFCEYFNSNYSPFKAYARECYDKVKTGLRDMQSVLSTQVCLKIPQFSDVQSSIRLYSYLTNLVERYLPSSMILPPIYDKLFAKMIEFSSEDEEEFQQDCEVVRKAQRFGLDEEIESCQFVESHEVLRGINGVKTPWEKLIAITKIASTIDGEIKAHLAAVNPERAEKWSMSADQYFPILTKFIAMKPVPNLIANMTFISEFSLCPMSSSEQKYHFINVLATVQSIKKHAEEARSPPDPIPPPPPNKPAHSHPRKPRNDHAISLSDSSGSDDV